MADLFFKLYTHMLVPTRSALLVRSLETKSAAVNISGLFCRPRILEIFGTVTRDTVDR
jgi:hypothetical protein